jgi:hypothetical protein
MLGDLNFTIVRLTATGSESGHVKYIRLPARDDSHHSNAACKKRNLFRVAIVFITTPFRTSNAEKNVT